MKDGTLKWVRAIGEPVVNENGEVVQIVGIIQDITERKLAEQSLQEAEVELKHTIEVVPGIISKADAHTGYFTHCNPALSNILGFSSEEFMARPFIEFVHPDDRQSTINEVEKQLKGSPVARFENRYICKDGSYRWLSWMATAADEKGVVYAAATDITDRKQAEEQIENLAKFPSENPYPILRIFVNGTILYANEASVALLKDRKSGIDQPAPEQWQRVVENVLASGLVERMEVTHQERVFAFRAIPVTAAGYVNFYGVDITERKRASEQIRQQHEFMNNVLESLTHPFYIIDANDYTVKLMNSAANLNDAPERSTCYALTHRLNEPCAGKGMLCPLEEVKETGKPVTTEHIHYDKDGNARHVEIHGYPMFDDQGNVSQMIEYCLDITERKQAEKELLEYQGQLRRLASQLSKSEEREKRRIVVGLHDDILQPLIFLDVKLASLFKTDAGTKPPDSLKEIQGIVAGLLHQMRSLTFDLSNPLLYELGLEAAVKDWLTNEVRKKHGLKTAFKAEGLTGSLDQDVRIFLYKAIRELVTNVIKHANANDVTVSIFADDDNVTVSVRDDGEGFDIDEKEKLRFDRDHGFGLFSIQERLKSYGGTMAIGSSIGKGTEIILTMPLNVG